MKKENLNNEKEEFIKSCMVNNILSIDKLSECKDLNLIKESLYSLPIDLYEFLQNLFDQKQYRKIFEFAVDNNISNADGMAQVKAIEKMPEIIYDIFRMLHEKFEINRNYIKYPGFSNFRTDVPIIKKTLEEVKKDVILKLGHKIAKERLTEDLTKEYFLELLTNNNSELLIIKLCVKLEAILIHHYYYEGTFEEMLNKYTAKNCIEDDGWGYYVPNGYSRLLNKLRIHRNGIVHTEKPKETLDIDELKMLIDYICKLG